MTNNYPKPKRMYTKIRTDAMENKIAWAIFSGNYESEETLRDLCTSFGIPIREMVITDTVDDYKRINEL